MSAAPTARRQKPAAHVLTLDTWHPCRLNRLLGCHWGTRSKRKRLDRERIAVEALAQGIPKATGERRVSLVLTLAPRQRAGDPDAYWKSTLDALAACGLLLDDNRRWCELGPVRFERGSARRTVILLADV